MGISVLAASLLATSFVFGPSDEVPAPVPAPSTEAVTADPGVTRADLERHYDAVLAQLREVDTSGFDPARSAARAAALAALDAYRASDDFGLCTVDPSTRGYSFVDADGRRCAVAHVLDAFGEHDLVLRIAATRNGACVSQLLDEPGLPEALARTGLSVEEAARIQGPHRNGQANNWNTPAPAPTSPTFVMGRSSRGGAAVSGADQGSAASTGSGSSPSTADSGPHGTSARTGSARTRSARSAITSGDDQVDFVMEPWWSWWEMNKLRFLRPHRLDDGIVEVTSERYGTMRSLASRDVEALRARVVEKLRDAVDDDVAEVRGRAAVALGRLEGAGAVASIMPLLDDPSRSVRECAVLGLGATRSPAAVSTLLRMASDDDAVLGDEGRQLALLSLALARRGGLPDSVDALVSDWISTLPRDAQEDVAGGAMLYEILVHDEELADLARQVAGDVDERSELRCLAASALRQVSEPALDVPALTLALGDRDQDMRRAAALSLGRVPHDLVTGPLTTAFEVEHDPRTRGALLVSLGERGDPAARDVLLDALEDGDREVRAFAAFGAGMHARITHDERTLAALRDGLDKARNRDLRGAFVLALGMAQDARAVPALAKIVERDREGRMRSFAALALGMIGDADATAALRARVGTEKDELARTGLAQALGLLGDQADTKALLDTLREVGDPALRTLVAVGMAFHGTRPCAAGLLELVDDERSSDATRAAAIEALGLMLDPQPGLQLADVTSSANTERFPEWLLRAVSTFTL